MIHRDIYVQHYGAGPHNCYYCGKEAVLADIDHIDGNKKNNSIENLAWSHVTCHQEKHEITQKIDSDLMRYGRLLSDLEKSRVGLGNRLNAIQRFENNPLASNDIKNIVSPLENMEILYTKALVKEWKQHPLSDWCSGIKGLSSGKNIARLIASTGEPSDREFVSSFLQYCGYGAPSKRTKGSKSWWNPEAKKRVYLIVDSFVKHRTEPYRTLYDSVKEEARVKHSDWTDGHIDNHARRLTGKQFLKDLWNEAKRIEDSIAQNIIKGS